MVDYRYHTDIPAESGWNSLPQNGCSVIDLNLLRLEPGQSYTGQSGDREYLAVILGGKATFTVGGTTFEAVGGRPNVFGGKPHSVYIPRGKEFTVTGVTAVEIILPSAPSDLDLDPYVIGPDRVAAGRWGAANFGRNFHQILTEIAQPDLPASRLIVGETYTPSGNWSTFPPHRHQNDDLPREAQHEEGYYFRVSPGGLGISRVHTDEGYSENYSVGDHAVQMMWEGYHTVVSAPGSQTYYLWFLGGVGRTQGAVPDPNHGWVEKTVPMLRDLGH
ncbi:5-deoxy-glucuronate isomerase [Cellulomonas sp. NPDC089187]|uniref:5-deoxy-glucuronate isomerase n=1 Tax=Cellulomonas sp. NPDC089187 TaxID=3154970 RepID=UPI00341BEE52